MAKLQAGPVNTAGQVTDCKPVGESVEIRLKLDKPLFGIKEAVFTLTKDELARAQAAKG